MLAQQMLPCSYVSAESALDFHGWTPESVHTVLSMTHGGKSVPDEHVQLGKFEFRRMTTNTGYFLQSVARHEFQQQVALIAEPLRALLDLAYLRKFEWQGLGFLPDGMRLDKQQLRSITGLDISSQLNLRFYNQQREKKLIIKLEVDANPPIASDFGYTYLNFPVDYEVCHQDLSSNFALKIHALLCGLYLKGRDWYDFS